MQGLVLPGFPWAQGPPAGRSNPKDSATHAGANQLCWSALHLKTTNPGLSQLYLAVHQLFEGRWQIYEDKKTTTFKTILKT